MCVFNCTLKGVFLIAIWRGVYNFTLKVVFIISFWRECVQFETCVYNLDFKGVFLIALWESVFNCNLKECFNFTKHLSASLKLFILAWTCQFLPLQNMLIFDNSRFQWIWQLLISKLFGWFYLNNFKSWYIWIVLIILLWLGIFCQVAKLQFCCKSWYNLRWLYLR